MLRDFRFRDCNGVGEFEPVTALEYVIEWGAVLPLS